MLRTILTFEDTYQKLHFLVFQDNFTEDRLYMINDYPDYLVEEYRSLLLSTSFVGGLESSSDTRGQVAVSSDQQLR